MTPNYEDLDEKDAQIYMHVLIHELIDLGLYKVIKVLVPKYIPSIMKKGDRVRGCSLIFCSPGYETYTCKILPGVADY